MLTRRPLMRELLRIGEVMRRVHQAWIGLALFAAACGGPQAPPPDTAQQPPAAQLGGQASGAGTLSADVGVFH